MIKVGDTANISKTFSRNDIHTFADISLDHNPLHFDASFTEKTIFGKPIVHGMLVASLISAILGNKLPGHGTIYLSQNILFRNPVYMGETVTASVEVTEVREKKQLATLKTLCRKDDGTLVIEGSAFVKYL